MRPDIDIVTFGCRLNIHESEVMRAHAADAGVTDTIVFNTCAVTGEAVRQARQAIRRAARERPGARILVTGCAAQTEPQTFANMPEVTRVIGNSEKLSAEGWRATANAFGIGAEEKIAVDDILSVKETALHLIDGLEGHTRAFVQVQNGCDHRCTFCIIPYGRGNSRSVPMGEVVTQIRRLTERGAREVVLTGVDITSYGSGLPGEATLGKLVRQILKHVPELERLRISSIDSVEADDDLMIALAEEERLMPHLHLSLQAGDDLILKRMKRRHSRGDAIRFCDEARRLRPDIVFGADIIAGFPTETDAMFEQSLDLVDACGLTHLHVFPYSPRPGTPAARMPQVDGRAVKERAKRLREKGEAAFRARLAGEVGARRQILAERGGIGRTEHFLPVRLTDVLPGSILDCMIAGEDGKFLTPA
ncbi:threonylcarbamoyladenosine tRNA methylthiotransferase MtaB [Variibacter gotjawalensis]|uniref:Threonylcarbamoyladenosine tRNA methylthiotransferase MtaB n=1 Tax=Variibacter gotjawalensis TaxID=1333996 RepID=A0A0S3PS13_9BRAD|nr:tRNA (N(6)-L-threonylcarbamoyladenosine(37)-C(2))-methylthiotransferase MtaB [Variibacter gotjawalensis]NIK49051.1 threonylcarbamoyladenosine tRNA methylthiotransferase MtaB [Variibacter gotjawalensis]RZS50907.1 threonylcarbamoyladenosine tRNA methylthiotransferase MtaB [Variibacter gotjawalensis]BAT58741.1 threonylcarbamoyladenosine tRNA methylthiotransferase MtaB [Variibacter gotjawalensis]